MVGIIDKSGNLLVSYTYDAWGNVLSVTGSMASTLGRLNPLTYRGYVYDWETGLYYLQSRYYNPEWGRFINADVYVATGQGFVGNNMFAYCNNNPVNYIDPTGCLLVVDDVVIFGTVALTVLFTLLLVPPPVTTDVHFGSSSPSSMFGSETVTQSEQTAEIQTAKTKGKENVRDTGLQDLSDAEIQRRARDHSLSPQERRRYNREEKARGLRNRVKRQELY